jgi:Cytochrome c7 and related cytochrome c
MAQVFPHSANILSRVSIVMAGFLAALIAITGAFFVRSDYLTQRKVARVQPVQFSHKHHVAGIGIDCRYCHTSVETSAFAGVPPTKTCMSCHSQIWTNSPELEPVRESFRTGEPIRWERVHNLADFVYFNHSIHVNKGVGCATCHGRVDQMPLVSQENTLFMEWCLNCHRNPEKFLRPQDQIFNMEWVPPADQEVVGRELAKKNNIQSKELLTSCSTCHR